MDHPTPEHSAETVRPHWTVERKRIYADDGDVCSVPGCGVGFDDLGYLIDVTVLTSPGEEGYAEVTQWFCQEHYEEMAPKLMALGFASHNHHGTNLLDAEAECGGYGRCPHPVEYGPELVVPVEPDPGQYDGPIAP
jgi:hypothetical protein